MGCDMVRPTLEGIKTKVILLGEIYFVTSEALELVENVGNINDAYGSCKNFPYIH